MRPVRLDLEGFAAFRDRASVDFTGADYFALVGPTGSGKSTVIDAMTFALYGSAPRWGSVRSVQYALAPTANRATVRLVFDVADQRYAVAREVRRSGKQTAQKSCVLERYADPAATGDPVEDEPTEVLAGDAKSVVETVIDLLGLDFEDFCTCVVLPQGDFATFLKASVAQRQDILLKLLGAKHYDEIGRRAGRRAADANARIDALQGQLGSYADATEDHEVAAKARQVELTERLTQTRDQVAELSELLGRRATSAGTADVLTSELSLLQVVSVPAGVEELQNALTLAERAHRSAVDAEQTATAAMVTADEAAQAGPDRILLEETLRWHAEWARESTRTPEVSQAEEAAVAVLDRARSAAEVAERHLAQTREQHDTARRAYEQATGTLTELTSRVAALGAVMMPDGIADLDEAAAAAGHAREVADQRVEAAERLVVDTRAAVAELPERSAITALHRTIDAYATTASRLDDLRAQVRAIAEQAEAAGNEVARCSRDSETARTEVETLRTHAVAADLRPHLEVGQACPVCDQSVLTLPPSMAAPDLDAARAVLATAEDRQRAAEATAADLRTRRVGVELQADDAAERLTELGDQLSRELPSTGSGGDVRDFAADRADAATLLARLDAAQRDHQTAVGERETARAAQRRTHQDATRIGEEINRGWASLHAAHGRLTALGAPTIPVEGLGAAWSVLVDWASGLTDQLVAEEVPSAQDRLAAARQQLGDLSVQLQTATEADRRAGEELTTAAVAEGHARTACLDLTRRLAELEALLAERPAQPEAERLLAEHRRLDEEARTARAEALRAGQARQRTGVALESCRADRDQARTALRQAREPLVPLGAPALDDADLHQAWGELATWTQSAIGTRREQLVAVGAQLVGLDGELTTGLESLAVVLTEPDDDHAGASPAPGVPTLDELTGAAGAGRLARIPTTVELLLERARSATAEIIRRRRESEQLQIKIDTDIEIEQVSRALQQMMSARKFPQWLANAALDTLVADASASLLQLSGGQFELTHERGEFFVVDHADADSLRSVKTLSGGETFQASLALALALSAQLSTLAAGGRTTLDSIFLDEGFGTLDPDALEIVASTLENLAQGNRMVGVVTHVAALAERVPVRFEISRDSRTSMIERVGA